MRFLCHNLAPIYVALVAALMAWIYGGTVSWSLVKTVPWLMLFMVELIFIFPQQNHGESSYDARQRVWGDMRKDPVVWLALGFLGLLVIPFVNNGLCENCDAALLAQGMSAEPSVTFLPFCVDRLDHLNVFLWFVTALSAMIATRHCLTKHGKRLLVELLVWSGMALAIFGFVEIATDAPGPYWQAIRGCPNATFFSTWGYVNMAGDYFTTMFALSIALWRWRLAETKDNTAALGKHGKHRDIHLRQNLYLIPAAFTFFAALNTLSRWAIVAASSLALIFFLHAFYTLTAKYSRARRVRAAAIWGGILFGVVFFCYNFTPKSIEREMNSMDVTEALDRVTGKTESHVSVATDLWKDHLLFGCGGWGYRHFAYSKMDPKTVAQMKKSTHIGSGSANVHNDYMQTLAEHGLVGLTLLVLIVLVLLRPYYLAWHVMVNNLRFATKDRPPRPVQIFVVPASAFCILLALLATLGHAFADCPFRSAAILTTFFVLLPAIDGFMPDVDLEEFRKIKAEKRRARRHARRHRHHEQEQTGDETVAAPAIEGGGGSSDRSDGNGPTH